MVLRRSEKTTYLVCFAWSPAGDVGVWEMGCGAAVAQMPHVLVIVSESELDEVYCGLCCVGMSFGALATAGSMTKLVGAGKWKVSLSFGSESECE